MKKLFYSIILLLFAFTSQIKAQQIIQIDPLFEYPVAPENMESLEEKCNFLVKNFWNNFDFKKKESVDQYALNEAFSVYVTPMRYASIKEVDQSVDKLINKISGNPAVLLQFTKAAEENLYGPRADFWSDALYMKFLDAVIKNKKIPEKRKLRFISQVNSLSKSKEGNIAPSFDFIDINGDMKTYFPMSTPTLLIFGNPEDTDWRLARLKLDSNFKLVDAVDKGKINILYILPESIPHWQQTISNYNKHWSLGLAPNVSEIYDIRLNPSIYIVASDGKIIKKFPVLEEAVNSILEFVN